MKKTEIGGRHPLSERMDKEQLEQLEKLAALNYSSQDMALFFNLDPEQFLIEARDESSAICRHIYRGRFIVRATEQMALLDAARGGDVQASQRLDEIRRTREFELTKLDVFGGFDDPEKFEKLQDYILSGSRGDLSANEQVYLEILTLIHSMERKYGRRDTILFFTRDPYGFSYQKAAAMYDESINFFYTDRRIEKSALRHKKAEMLDEMARQVRQSAKTAKDFDIAAGILMKAAVLQELDKPDPVTLPREVYRKPVQVFTLDPAQVGLGGINRLEVAAQIDSLELPESDKQLLRQDAMIEDISFEMMIDGTQEKIDTGQE